MGRWRKNSFVTQSFAQLDAVAQIHGKDVHRRPTDGCTPKQDSIIPFEMLLPTIASRVE